MTRRRQAILEDLIKTEKIRDCHSDLRCGHIYFTDNIQVIDCIEFNDRFRCADVAWGVVHVIMDLEHEGLAEAGRRLLDAFVLISNNPDLYVLVGFYKCYRAMAKSKISFITIQQPSPGGYLHKQLSRRQNG